MTSAKTSPAEVAPQLTQALTVLRRRRRLRALLTVGTTALAVGLLTLVLARLAGQFAQLPVAPEALALGSGVVAAMIGLAVSSLRAPQLEQMARSADAQLALDERLSSALEVAEDWPRGNNVITSALISDVEQKAAGFDLKRLAPLRSRALTGTAAAAVLAGIGALLVPASANVPQVSVGVEESAEAAAEDVTLDDAQIRQIADLLRKDGERRRNDLLQAIANSVEKLAEETAAGRPVQEASEELRQLLEMAREAYGASAPSWMPPDPSNLAELEQRLEIEEAKANMPAAPQGSYDNFYDMGYYAPRDLNERERSSLPEELRNLGQQGEGDMNASVTPSDQAGEGEIDPNMPFEAKPLEEEEAGEIVATPAGAASDSNKGESQMAGGGGEAMTANDLAAAEFQATAEMSIRSEKPESEGKRIRLELPPDTQASDAGDANLGPGERGRAVTDAVSRSLVDAQARGLVARYFARKQG